MSICRSCHAPVRWVRTVRGKNHPLDAVPTSDGEWVISNQRRADGACEVMLKATPEHGDTPRYTSHFATCEQSKQWSRKGQR